MTHGKRWQEPNGAHVPSQLCQLCWYSGGIALDSLLAPLWVVKAVWEPVRDWAQQLTESVVERATVAASDLFFGMEQEMKHHEYQQASHKSRNAILEASCGFGRATSHRKYEFSSHMSGCRRRRSAAIKWDTIKAWGNEIRDIEVKKTVVSSSSWYHISVYIFAVLVYVICVYRKIS